MACKDSEYWLVMNFTRAKEQNTSGDIVRVQPIDNPGKNTARESQLVTLGQISQQKNRPVSDDK